MDVTELLRQVKDGTISVEAAEKELKKLPYEDLGFAKLDHHRKVRQGFEEVIYCSGKTTEHLVKIYRTLAGEGINVLGTRASGGQYEAVREAVPEAVYDPISRILKVEKREKEKSGKIVVCTGGTADVPVAEEAAQTAEFFGTQVVRLFDVGVAGIHRLLSNMNVFEGASWHGGGSGRGGRRTGGGARDCGTYLGRLWSKLSRSFRTFDHAEFLRKWYHSGEYRQWLWGGLCGDTD